MFSYFQRALLHRLQVLLARRGQLLLVLRPALRQLRRRPPADDRVRGPPRVADLAGGQGVTSLEAMKKMVKEGKKKPNEFDKTVQSVDYSSSR